MLFTLGVRIGLEFECGCPRRAHCRRFDNSEDSGAVKHVGGRGVLYSEVSSMNPGTVQDLLTLCGEQCSIPVQSNLDSFDILKDYV